MLHWAKRGLSATAEAAERSGRTWFGTLTLDAAALIAIGDRARLASDEPEAPWWDDVRPTSYFCRKRKKVVTVRGHICDRRFALMRDQLILECRRMWARLRKRGHKFSYLLVFERHKSGEPHMHFLLHEKGSPILKRQLAEQWPHGFTKIKLVGAAKRQVPADQAAFYVAKYLAKDFQARQIASKGYGKNKCALAAITNE